MLVIQPTQKNSCFEVISNVLRVYEKTWRTRQDSFLHKQEGEINIFSGRHNLPVTPTNNNLKSKPLQVGHCSVLGCVWTWTLQCQQQSEWYLDFHSKYIQQTLEPFLCCKIIWRSVHTHCELVSMLNCRILKQSLPPWVISRERERERETEGIYSLIDSPILSGVSLPLSVCSTATLLPIPPLGSALSTATWERPSDSVLNAVCPRLLSESQRLCMTLTDRWHWLPFVLSLSLITHDRLLVRDPQTLTGVASYTPHLTHSLTHSLTTPLPHSDWI